MQPQYMAILLRLSSEARYEIERAFALPRRGSLYFRLKGIDQARVVLVLARAGLWEDVSLLVGHNVPTFCPPCLSRLNVPTVTARTPDDERVISWVTGVNPRIVSDMLRRFSLVKPGMTVQQLLSRGVTRRDLREWVYEGSIRVERVGAERTGEIGA